MAFRRWARRTCIPRFILAFIQFFILTFECVICAFICGRIIGIAFTRRCVATVGGAFFLFYPCIAYTFLEFAIGALEFAIVANLRRGWASVAFPRYCIAPHCALLCRICAVFAHLAMLAITPAFPIGARRTTFVFGTTISTTSRQCYQR